MNPSQSATMRKYPAFPLQQPSLQCKSPRILARQINNKENIALPSAGVLSTGQITNLLAGEYNHSRAQETILQKATPITQVVRNSFSAISQAKLFAERQPPRNGIQVISPKTTITNTSSLLGSKQPRSTHQPTQQSILAEKTSTTMMTHTPSASSASSLSSITSLEQFVTSSQSVNSKSFQKILTSRSRANESTLSSCSSLGTAEMRRLLRGTFQQAQRASFAKPAVENSSTTIISKQNFQLSSRSQNNDDATTTTLKQSTNIMESFDHCYDLKHHQRPSTQSISSIDLRLNRSEINGDTDRDDSHRRILTESGSSQYDDLLAAVLNTETNTNYDDNFINDNQQGDKKELFPDSPKMISKIYNRRRIISTKFTASTSSEEHLFLLSEKRFQTIEFLQQNRYILEIVSSFLDMKSCLQLGGTHNFFRIERKVLKVQIQQLLIKGLLPRNIRAAYWAHISGSREFRVTFPVANYHIISECEPRCEREIVQDLQKVLRALSFSVPDMEYCQGLNFVVGGLLLYASEEDAYFVCMSMLKNYGLKECFFDELSGLQQAVRILDSLIRLYFPHVSDFLKKKQIQTGLFSTSWFNTLFSYDFPRSFFIRAIDLFLFSGWKVLFQIALAIINEAQTKLFLLETDDDIINLIKKAFSLSEDRILNHLKNFNISNRMVFELSRILTQHDFVRNLSIAFDLKAKKRYWEFEIDTNGVFDELSTRNAAAVLALSKRRQQKENANAKDQGFFADFISAFSSKPQVTSQELSKRGTFRGDNGDDYEREITLKKRDFKNFSSFSSSNLNGSRHFLAPFYRPKQTIVKHQTQGRTPMMILSLPLLPKQTLQEPCVNFDMKMLEQPGKIERNSIKSHPKKFISNIKNSFLDA